jgi:hypothetical protein
MCIAQYIAGNILTRSQGPYKTCELHVEALRRSAEPHVREVAGSWNHRRSFGARTR